MIGPLGEARETFSTPAFKLPWFRCVGGWYVSAQNLGGRCYLLRAIPADEPRPCLGLAASGGKKKILYYYVCSVTVSRPLPDCRSSIPHLALYRFDRAVCLLRYSPAICASLPDDGCLTQRHNPRRITTCHLFGGGVQGRRPPNFTCSRVHACTTSKHKLCTAH